MTCRIITPLLSLLLASIAILSSSQHVGAAAPSVTAPNGAAAVMNAKCTGCHGVAQITMQRKTPQDWAETVQTMVDRGADLTTTEQKTITAYLGKAYPAN